MEFKNFFKKNQEQTTAPEKLDNSVEQKIENLDNKAKDILKLIEEVGGQEGIEKTLKEYDQFRIEEIKKKMEDCLEESKSCAEVIGSRLLSTELPTAVAIASFFLLEYFGKQGMQAEAMCSVILGAIALAPAAMLAASDAHFYKTIGGIGFAIETLKHRYRYKKLEKEKEEIEN